MVKDYAPMLVTMVGSGGSTDASMGTRGGYLPAAGPHSQYFMPGPATYMVCFMCTRFCAKSNAVLSTFSGFAMNA